MFERSSPGDHTAEEGAAGLGVAAYPKTATALSAKACIAKRKALVSGTDEQLASTQASDPMRLAHLIVEHHSSRLGR